MQIEIKDRILPRCWLEIDLAAITENVRNLRAFLKSETGIIAVVKSNAYGHGIVEVAESIIDYVDTFAVSSLDEALFLRESGVSKPILFLSNPIGEEDLDFIFQNNITPAINGIEYLDVFEKKAKASETELDVHLNIDTGMSRLGVLYDGRHAFLNSLNKISALNIRGCFTHFAHAENIEYTRLQQGRFEKVSNMLKSSGHNFKQHAANSSAALRMPSVWYDYVRPGLILYGIYPDAAVKNRISIKQAMSFKTKLIQVKNVKKGTYIGYCCTYKAPSDMAIGVVPVGYNQGIPWSFSNKGCMLLRGRRVSILGRVSMDQVVLDLREIENPGIGEEIVITGTQVQEELGIEELAELSNTIPYEIVCGFGKVKTKKFLKSEEGGDCEK